MPPKRRKTLAEPTIGRPLVGAKPRCKFTLSIDADIKSRLEKAWPAYSRGREIERLIAAALDADLPEDRMVARIRRLSTPQRQVVERLLDSIGVRTPR